MKCGGEQMGKIKEIQAECSTQSTHTEDLLGTHCAKPQGEGMRYSEYSKEKDAVLACL